MTTTVLSRHDVYPNVTVENIADHTNMWITLAGGDGREVSTTVDRAEFLAAVEAELNVIIIPRTDLPEVIETEGANGHRVLLARGATLRDGMATGSDALGWLAIDEYLEAHPPVDRAAVDALIEAIVSADDNADLTGAQIAHLARRLIRAGVRPPKDT